MKVSTTNFTGYTKSSEVSSFVVRSSVIFLGCGWFFGSFNQGAD